MKSLFTAMALLLGSLSMLHAQSANKPMSGTYTIAYENADFEDIRSAIDSLMKNGVNGPVKMLVKNGTYNSLYFHDSIPGSSAKNTVTFRSATGQRDSVRIYDTYGTKLANTCHLRFEELTLDGIIVGVEMDSSVSDVEIRHCNIVTQINSNYLYKGVEYPGTATNLARRMDNVRLIANSIRGGYYNIYLNNFGNNKDANDTGFTGVIIDSNTLCDATYYGLYAYQYGVIRSFSHNTVTNYHPDFKYYGVYCATSKWIRMDGNRIHVNNNQLGYGIYFGSNYNNTSNRAASIVCNNEIILGDSNVKYGIYMGNFISPVEVVNNSILLRSPTISYGLYLGNTNTSFRPLVYNNMVVNGKNDGYPIYIAYAAYASTKYYNKDYNNYYSGGAYIAFFGSKKKTIREVRNTDTASDQHSVSIAPVWVDSILSLEYKKNNHFTCPTLENVTADIIGRPRFVSMNAMGCYSRETDSNDAFLTGFADMEKIVSTAACPVKAVIMNVGAKPISAASITLWIDNVKKVTVKYTPSKPLPFQKSDTVNLGSFQLSSETHRFLACVQMENDSNSSNDSISYSRFICEKPFSGTFVIGNSKSADFTFEDIATLFAGINHCGVNGDITLAIEDGTYDGGIDLATIATIMNGHHLTLTSKSKNSGKVTIRDSISRPHILNIGEGNRNVTVEHLTFQRIADTNLTCINMTGCENILIRNNRLLMDTNTQKGCYLIHANYSKGNVNGLTIKNNFLLGGNRGIHINGTNQNNICQDIVVDSNELIGQNGPATCLQYAYAKSISHNVMIFRKYNSNPGSFKGIYISYAQVDSIIGNWIDGYRDTMTQNPAQGMYLNYLNYYSGTTTLVANNCIQSNFPAIHAINASMHFYHNTIRATSANPKANSGYCIFINGSAHEENHLYGNIFDATKAEYILYVITNNDAKRCVTNRNSYCNTNGKKFACINGVNCRTLDEMRIATQTDTHSVHIKPTFKELDNNMGIVALPQMLVPRLNSVPKDFSNRARAAQTLMGACDSDLDKTDAALCDFSRTKLTQGSKSQIYVSLVNMGSSPLTSATIRWSVNGTNQSAVSWSGSLASRVRTEVQLGDIVPDAYNRLEVWVEKPNAGSDANHANDTIRQKIYLCNGPIAEGSYTMGGYDPYFKDVEELTAALYSCGIAGQVVVRVRTGRYGILQLKDSIPGSSNSNTLTIVAEKGDSPLFDGGADYAGLDINNLKYTTFKNLTFGNLKNGLMGVKMDGHCSHVTIRDCRIYACTTSTTSDCRALSYTQSETTNYAEEVRLTANQITGGYYNLYLNQIGGSSINMAISSMHIDSNTLTEAYCSGIYTNNYGRFPSISHNTIQSRYTNDDPLVNYYGIYSYNNKVLGRMEGNRIFVYNSTSSYGITLQNNQNSPLFTTHSAIICNNEIRIFGEGYKCGIYADGRTGFLDIHHNSIYVNADNGVSLGILFYPSISENIKSHITRNLIVSEGKNAAPIQLVCQDFYDPQYYGTDYSLREWNNFYSDTCVGYTNDRLIRNIADLQAVTKQDSHSLSILPPFANIANGLELKSYDTLHCPRLDSVQTDIDGHRRNVSTNIGCHADPIHRNVYTVTLYANNTIMGETTGAGSFDEGTMVKINAIPKEHFHFVRWNDGNKENPRYITLKKDTSFTAIFGIDTHKVILLSNDTNLGKVTGDGLYAYGSVATLTASPKEGNSFKQWSDNNKTNPRQITVTADVSLTAIFVSGDGIAERLPDGMAVYSNDMCIYVKRAEGKAVSIFNTAGQLLLQNEVSNSPEQFRMPAKGVYYVKIGSCHPVKVVVF